jgi:hypothetical protein
LTDLQLEALLERITDELKSAPETVGVLFHGSFLKGTPHKDSDLDILCLTEADWFSMELRDNGEGPKIEIQRTPLQKVRAQLAQYSPGNQCFALTLLEARVLFDRDGRIAELIEEIREAARQLPPAPSPLESKLFNAFLRNRLSKARHILSQGDPEGLARPYMDLVFYNCTVLYCKFHRRWGVRMVEMISELKEEHPEFYGLCRSYLRAGSQTEALAALEDVVDAVTGPEGRNSLCYQTPRVPAMEPESLGAGLAVFF